MVPEGDFNRTVLDSLTAHIAVFDKEGTIIAVNRAWLQFAVANGNPPPSLIGVGANYFSVLRKAMLAQPEDAVAVLEGLEKLQHGELQEFTHEYSCHSPSERRWFLLRATQLGGGSGTVVAHEPTTERRLLEDRLAEESRIAERLNCIGQTLAAELDLQRVVAVLTDETTKLTGARFGAFFYTAQGKSGESLLLYALSGASRDAFANFPVPRRTKLFGPTLAGEAVIRLDDVTQDARYGQNPPYRGLPEGHVPVRSYLAVPVVSRSGEVLGALFFGHPQPGVFTERHERLAVGVAAQAGIAIDNARLYQQSQQASRSKDEFLAILSHELRQPLNSILGWTQILQHGDLAPEQMKHGLEVIQRSVRAQTSIMSDLLDISRIAAGKLNFEMTLTDPAAAIEAALEYVRALAEAKSLRLDFTMERSHMRVLADPIRLQQIVANLLLNAVKFTPEGGRVEVRLERTDSRVRIEVSDTGKGIAPESMPHLFKRFWQADDSATRRRYGGFGMGLAIVRHLVELHRGTVRAESPGEGRGATFTVELPRAFAEDHTDAALPGGAEGAAPCLHGLKILVVDDEADVRELSVMVLGRHGVTVQTAGSTSEGVAAFQCFDPDVLVCDIGMPGEDGYELIKQIRKLGSANDKQVPAVAMTALARKEDRERCLAAGFQGHLPKPVEAEQLIHAVIEALETSGRR